MSTNYIDHVKPNEQDFAQDAREIIEEETLTGITGGIKPAYVNKVFHRGKMPDIFKLCPTTTFKRGGALKEVDMSSVNKATDERLKGNVIETTAGPVPGGTAYFCDKIRR